MEKKRTILIVDDHVATADVLQLVLRRSGYEVETAHSVAAALEIAHAMQIDLLISDIGLPDGTGIELLEQLRSAGPLRAIAISGYGMREDFDRSTDGGFTVHLLKPFSTSKL